MEALGIVVPRPIPFFSGADGADPQATSFLCSFGGVGQLDCSLRRSSSRKPPTDKMISVFSDKGRLDYYYSSPKVTRRNKMMRFRREAAEASVAVGGKKEKLNKERDNSSVTKENKKRLKMLKGLSRDLAMFSQMGFGLDPADSDHNQVKAKMISDAAVLLQRQLQELCTEQMELKMKRKEEKSSRLNLECEMSSSSSSESSDSECEEVVDINLLKCKFPREQPVMEHNNSALPRIFTRDGTAAELLAPPIPAVRSVFQSTEIIEEKSTLGWGVEIFSSECLEQGCCSIHDLQSENATAGSTKQIEVCMGGKCKKSGATVLLEEFQKVVGVEGTVSGCKCLGKCRDGPNVRILTNCDDLPAGDPPSRAAANPLCIGVSLEDVDLIVAKYLGGSQKEFGLSAAS